MFRGFFWKRYPFLAILPQKHTKVSKFPRVHWNFEIQTHSYGFCHEKWDSCLGISCRIMTQNCGTSLNMWVPPSDNEPLEWNTGEMEILDAKIVLTGSFLLLWSTNSDIHFLQFLRWILKNREWFLWISCTKSNIRTSEIAQTQKCWQFHTTKICINATVKTTLKITFIQISLRLMLLFKATYE